MSLRGEVLRLGIRFFLKRRARPFSVQVWRDSMRAMERYVPRPPANTETEVVELGALRLHRIRRPASRPDRHVLYLHGGGYISGGPNHYRHLTWRLADAAEAVVWVLAYRLAPEHMFPAALEDAAGAHAFILGMPQPRELFVMGDSAGGGLALALLLKLRDEGHTLPRAAVAMSPWTDLALTGPSLAQNARSDPMLNADELPALVPCYVGNHDPKDPYVSPLYGDVRGLPPVLIQVGGDEVLLDDAVRMGKALERANPLSRLEVWPRMPHVFQLFMPVLPEARAAIAGIGKFVRTFAT